MAVQLKPAPILAHSSSSQRARLRAIREELSPGVFGSGTSNDDLIRSIQGSIAQTSAMWLLHRGLDVVQDHGESLEQQILQFSSAVFDAIGSSYPVLRNVAQERLWLIYFKGLLSQIRIRIKRWCLHFVICFHERSWGVGFASRETRVRPRRLPLARFRLTKPLKQITLGLQQKIAALNMTECREFEERSAITDENTRLGARRLCPHSILSKPHHTN